MAESEGTEERRAADKGRGLTGSPKAERGLDAAFIVLVLVMIGAFVAVFAALALLRLRNFGCPGFDNAIFDQVVWKLSRFEGATSSIRGVNLFGDHFAPILFAMVPLYWVKGNLPAMISVQVIAVGLGALPLYLLSRDKLKSRWLGLAIGAAYLLYPAVQYLVLCDYHPETIGLCLLLFAFLAIDRRRFGWFYVCCAGAAFCKEDMVLAVLVLGILVYFKYDRRAGSIVSLTSLAYFVATVFLVIPRFSTEGYQYSTRLSQFGESPLEALKNMIVHPFRTLEILVSRLNARYVFDLLTPVAFLCLLAPLLLLPALPAFLINIVSNFKPQHEITHQYTAAIVPFLFIATVFAFRKLRRWARGASRSGFVVGAVAFVLLACSLAGSFCLGPGPFSDNWKREEYTSSPHKEVMREAIAVVPDEASVSSQMYFLQHLSEREHLYMFPNPFIDYVDDECLESMGEDRKGFFPNIYRRREPGEDPGDYPVPEVDYVVLDRKSPMFPLTEGNFSRLVERLTLKGGYRQVFERDGVLVLRDGDAP